MTERKLVLKTKIHPEAQIVSNDVHDRIFLDAIMEAAQLSKQGKQYKRALNKAKKHITPDMRKALKGIS